MFQVEVFWVVTSCGVVLRMPGFGGLFCLHISGEENGAGKWGIDIRGCIQKFPNSPPGAITANDTALCL
jgi:hypothetical protein